MVSSAKMLTSNHQSTGVSPSSSNLGSQLQVVATWQNSGFSVSGSVGGSCLSATYSVPSVFASGSSKGEFGALVGAFPALGSSTSSTNASPISAFGSPSLFSSCSVHASSCNRFGFQPQDGGFGQSSSSFAPRSFGSTPQIATLGQPTAFAGNCTPRFAIFSSPLSSQSTFGASAALGSSTSSRPPAASISAFASPSLFSSGSSAVNSNTESLLFIKKKKKNTRSLFRQTSSSANQISRSSTVFGPSNQSTLVNDGTLFSNMHNSVTHACQCASSLGSSSASLSGFTIPAFCSPIAPSFTTFEFGKSDGHESLNSKPIFGQPNSRFSTNKEPVTGSFTSGPLNTTSKVKAEGFFPSADKRQYQGSGVASYFGTPEVDYIFPSQTSNKVVSISAMPTYKDKSHEELRLEDYQLSWEKGSSVFEKNPGSLFQQTQPTSANISGSFTKFSPPGQSTFVNNDTLVSGMDNSVSQGFKCFNCSMTPSFHFTIPTFCSHTADLVSNRAIGHRNITLTVSNKELGLSAIECQCQGSRIASYAATPEVLADVGIPTSGNNIVSISAMPTYEYKSHEELRFEDYQLTRGKGCFVAKNQFETGLSSTTRNLTVSPVTSISILSSGTTSGFSSGMNNNMNVSSSKLHFLQPSVGITNGLSESTTIQNQPSMSRAASTGPGVQKTQTAFTSNTAPINISHQSSADPWAGISSQKVYIQHSGSQNNLTIGWSPVTNLSGAEPTLQISVDPPVCTTTVQYGISRLSVNDNPSPVRRSSLLTVRHLSSCRNKVIVNKYKPENNQKKVPFYEEGLPGADKFCAPFIPRENLRALLLRPSKGWFPETKSSKSSVLEENSTGASN